jgi:mannose-6-phosphate isomerase
MENLLYPLKFEPILKDKIWGGTKLRDVLNKPTRSGQCGESWEISGVIRDISVVSNGFLEKNNLSEILEVYMGDLVGEKVYEKFGNEFPLLIKFIDANDDLSIQVHPDDELAKKRHHSYGKTEMWYVMEAEKDAKLVVGFNQKMDKEKYLDYLNRDKITEILNYETVAPGDVYFMPAGRVHAIGAGIMLAEIQQTSDVTYRIYDYNRKDASGQTRELHNDLAVDAIDYNYYDDFKTKYNVIDNKENIVVNCPYFTTNLLPLSENLHKDIYGLDSFVIYMCVDGQVRIEHSQNNKETINKGETVLIPAALREYTLVPEQNSKLLEVYIQS